ncbi:MAG: ABC transporter ATP-binding protein [Chloroflexi bacterium]|nr:ABC transporter ATP-binding protein [Chloroflexota bacterium]
MAAEQRPKPDGFAIETNDVWRVYTVGDQDVQALRGVSLQIAPGTFHAVKGRSGSGKTTLLNCVGGLDRPTSGVVSVLGHSLSEMNDEQLTRWRRERVGFIFQSFGLLPTLSAYENVELMLRIAGAPRQSRRERTMYCLELVGLKQWAHHRPYEMSGGQQQRVGIARALANQPELLLADEPTGELDSTTAREILGIFRRVVDEEHTTLMMVSHDMLVDEYADAVLELRDGQIVARH